MFYVLLFWASLKDVVREHEKKREATPTASHIYHQKRKEKNKTGISAFFCCFLLLLLVFFFFFVAYFQPATSTDRL